MSGPIPTEVANLRNRTDTVDIFEDFFRSGSTMGRDLFNLATGDLLGSGVSRSVYVCNLNPTYVMKFEHGPTFQNVMEWEIWSAVERDESPNSPNKWLAPCQAISPNGQILMQRRTNPLRREELPEKVPSWMCDTHLKNWGWYEGRPVLHDYGYTYYLGARVMNRMKKNLNAGKTRTIK